jgi:hypothetical protein
LFGPACLPSPSVSQRSRAPPALSGGAVHNMHSLGRMRYFSFCLLTALICTGCAAPTWTKPGLTQAEFLRDRYECERDSELVGAMPTGPYGGMILATAQIGLLARKREMKDMCMRAKGYVQGDEPSVDARSTLQAAQLRRPRHHHRHYRLRTGWNRRLHLVAPERVYGTAKLVLRRQKHRPRSPLRRRRSLQRAQGDLWRQSPRSSKRLGQPPRLYQRSLRRG